MAVLAVLRRRRAGWAWLLLAGYLGLQIVLVATSRAPVFGAEIGLAYRLQTDLVCALALCLGLAFGPLLGARQSSEPRAEVPGPAVLARLVSRSVPPTLAAGAVGLVALSGLVCWTTYAVMWHEHNDSRGYLRTLDRDLRRQGTTTLADDRVPDSVLPQALLHRGRGAGQQDGAPARPFGEFPASSSELAVVAENGELHKALVDPSAVAKPGPNPNCGWVGLSPKVRIPLTARTLDLDWWVRIGYLSTPPTTSRSASAGRPRPGPQSSTGSATCTCGPSGEFGSVVISGLEPDTRMCVDAVEVGTLDGRTPL